MPRIKKTNALANARTVSDTARNMRQGMVLAATAGRVIAARSARANDATEITRMVTEKVMALNEVSWVAAQHVMRMGFGFWSGSPANWWSDMLQAQSQMMRPMQRIAGANAKRLKG